MPPEGAWLPAPLPSLLGTQDGHLGTEVLQHFCPVTLADAVPCRSCCHRRRGCPFCQSVAFLSLNVVSFPLKAAQLQSRLRGNCWSAPLPPRVGGSSAGPVCERLGPGRHRWVAGVDPACRRLPPGPLASTLGQWGRGSPGALSPSPCSRASLSPLSFILLGRSQGLFCAWCEDRPVLGDEGQGHSQEGPAIWLSGLTALPPAFFQ